MSAVASVRAARSRVSARWRNASLLVFSASALSAWNASRSLRFGILVRLQPLGVNGAILFELGLETGVRGPRGQPADQRADGETRDDAHRMESSMVLSMPTADYRDTTNGSHDSGS